jgi:serpin B
VWGEQTYPWAQPFLTTLAKSYGTGVYLRDFVHQPDEARLTVDGWVSQETGGAIADLLPPGAVDDTTRVVLVNALHLRMPWDAPFNPSATASAVFTRGDGTTVSTPFMNAKPRGLPYVDDGKAQIVAVPLAGRSISVVFALPHGDLATYEAAMTALAVPTSQPMVTLSLPRFTFTSRGVSLAGPLQAMGMKQAFSATLAQFQGMCSIPPDGAHLHVGDVLQETTIGVQENGVEAAAATAVTEPGIATQHPLVLTLDRPFVVAIVDASGAVIFLGHVEDPTETTGD